MALGLAEPGAFPTSLDVIGLGHSLFAGFPVTVESRATGAAKYQHGATHGNDRRKPIPESDRPRSQQRPISQAQRNSYRNPFRVEFIVSVYHKLSTSFNLPRRADGKRNLFAALFCFNLVGRLASFGGLIDSDDSSATDLFLNCIVDGRRRLGQQHLPTDYFSIVRQAERAPLPIPKYLHIKSDFCAVLAPVNLTQ